MLCRTPPRARAALLGAAAFGAALAASPAALRAQFTGYTLNGTAIRSGNDLRLTPDSTGRVGSGWAPTALPTGSFTASWRFVSNSTGDNNGSFLFGDGVAFVLQNDPRGRNALGVACCGGMNGVSPVLGFYTSLGIAGISTNGDPNDPNGNRANFNTGSAATGDRFVDATLAYDAVAKTISFSGAYVGSVANNTFSITRTGVDLAALLGTATPIFGFTGSTSNDSADQRIRNFTFTPTGSPPPTNTVPEPAPLALFGAGLVALGAGVARRRAHA